MGIEEVGVRALASAPLRAEDAHESATLRGRPCLEVSDEGRDQRQLSEGASLGRRPGGPPGHAELAPRSGRRFPHGDAAVAAEVARDEAGERRFSPGDHLLLVTVGLGAVFGAAVVECLCHEGDER